MSAAGNAGGPADRPPGWPALLTTLLAGTALSTEQAAWAMRQVMAGEATPVQLAAFAVALRGKGETAAEVAGLAAAMLERAVPLDVPGPVVDTCGTGGDRAHTVNISTLAALVVAAAGERVVKHGNRAASSACGSADLLEALGVIVDLPPAGVARCVAEVGIGFCFAPVFHPAFRHAAAARGELGVPTVFNVLGPLTNPARPQAQAVGVADARLAPVLAGVLAGRDARALVFRGDDGLDELTIATTSSVWVVDGGRVSPASLDPVRLGVPPAPVAALRGGDAARNAVLARELLDGRPGPIRDAVRLNAAAALAAAAGDPGGLEDRMAAGLERATAALEAGTPAAVLERWVRVSRQASAQSESPSA